jgi:hypothetical protein
MIIHIEINTNKTDFPKDDDFDVRDALEDALETVPFISIVGMGSGLGTMDITIETDKRKETIRYIESVVDKLGVSEYITIKPEKRSKAVYRVAEGDIFYVEIGIHIYVQGIVLHVSKYFRKCMMVAFFDKIYQSAQEATESRTKIELIDTPNYVHVASLSSGHWTKAGSNKEMLSLISIPELAVSYSLYYKDTIIRQLQMEELSLYPSFSVSGTLAIENRLRRHFGVKYGQDK